MLLLKALCGMRLLAEDDMMLPVGVPQCCWLCKEVRLSEGASFWSVCREQPVSKTASCSTTGGGLGSYNVRQ